MSQVLYKYFNTNYENNQKKYGGETNRIKNLLKENSDLIERNKNLEQRLKILEQYVSTNPVQTNNANIYNINLSNNNNPPSLKNKQRKSTQFPKYNKKIINISKSNNLSKSSKKIRPRLVNDRNKKNNLTITNYDTKRNKTNLSYNLSKSKNVGTDTINSGIEFNQKERNEYNLKILNEMIEEKKNEIDSLEYELKITRNCSKRRRIS